MLCTVSHPCSVEAGEAKEARGAGEAGEVGAAAATVAAAAAAAAVAEEAGVREMAALHQQREWWSVQGSPG